MKSIVFIAPPAAGKGTQSIRICKEYHLSHISTGDLLREEINHDSEIGKRIKQIINDGFLVSDDIILSLLMRKLENIKGGYILDGFPRNLNQAIKYDEILNSQNKKLDYVIYINLDKELSKKRIIGRVSCPQCGNVYNNMLEENCPQKENICDNCQMPLIKRDDDNEEIFEKRYETYISETAPLIDYYQQKGILFEIDGSLLKDEIFKKICEVIND